MAMDDDGAPPRCSRGGLSALSHQLMRKFSAAAANKDYPDGKGVGGGENRSASAPGADNNNLVFSPLSIYSALSLAAAGAKGRTLRELLDALGATSRESLAENVRCIVDRALPATPQPKPKPKPKPEPGGGGGGSCVVEHACGLWHDAALTLKPAFHDVAAASYNAVALAVDFLNKPEEARKQINRWVAWATNNHIDTILPRGSVNQTTGMVVATAIYFKGKWRTPFDASLTKAGKFHRLDGTTVDGAQFMRSHSKQYIATYSGFKVLKMPYAAAAVDLADERRRRRPRWYDHPFMEWTLLQREPGTGTPPPARAVTSLTTPPQYSMLVLLPDTRDGLPALEDKMLASGGDFLERHTPERRVAVGDFRVPRFKLSFFTEAKSALQELGVRAVFDREAAQLPDVMEETTNNGGKGEPLFVGEVYHRAVIEVNEEGTEAAASTAMTMLATAARARPKPVDFVADHPFAFFVVEDVSGAILFAGHVHDPTKS